MSNLLFINEDSEAGCCTGQVEGPAGGWAAGGWAAGGWEYASGHLAIL